VVQRRNHSGKPRLQKWKLGRLLRKIKNWMEVTTTIVAGKAYYFANLYLFL
jgi:hypothetical protein